MEASDWSKRIGERLRELREARGWTQGEMGEVLGISRQGISELENGKSRITLDRLTRVLDKLGYELELFFVRKDN